MNNLKHLSDGLKQLSLKAGVAKEEDFAGLTPLDVIANFAISLSNGRITEDKDILARARGCGTVESFIKAFALPCVPVPSKEQIRDVLDGKINEWSPEPPKPTKHEQIAAACRKELKARRRKEWKIFWGYEGDTSTPAYARELEAAIQRIDKLDQHRVIREFVSDYGIPTYQRQDTHGLLGLMHRSKTAEEFLLIIEGKAKIQ